MPEVRPIDANALREEFKRGVNVVKGICNVSQILHNIDTAPTLDYEPVVHAHWIQKGFDCKCSNCGSFNGAFGVKYCQDCGAKMDEKMDEEVQSNANNNS